MNTEVEKINERIVSGINAILEYKDLQNKEVKIQDYLQARVHRKKRELQFELLLEDLAELRNLYSPNYGALTKEDMVTALGGIINLSKSSSPWD